MTFLCLLSARASRAARSWLPAAGVLMIASAAAQASDRNALAYNLLNCHWPGTHIAYTDRSGAYSGYTSEAVRRWQVQAPAAVWVPVSSGSVNVYAIDYGNAGYDGITSYECGQSGVMVAASASYNTHYTDLYDTEGRTQLMVHELGHVLGLAHSGSLPCPVPVMYYSSDRYSRCKTSWPQADDMQGVDQLYGGGR